MKFALLIDERTGQLVDCYAAFGVSHLATKQEIESAYRKKAAEYHPDRNKAPGAEDMFKKLTDYKEILVNEDERRQYDRALEQGRRAYNSESNVEPDQNRMPSEPSRRDNAARRERTGSRRRSPSPTARPTTRPAARSTPREFCRHSWTRDEVLFGRPSGAEHVHVDQARHEHHVYEGPRDPRHSQRYSRADSRPRQTRPRDIRDDLRRLDVDTGPFGYFHEIFPPHSLRHEWRSARDSRWTEQVFHNMLDQFDGLRGKAVEIEKLLRSLGKGTKADLRNGPISPARSRRCNDMIYIHKDLMEVAGEVYRSCWRVLFMALDGEDHRLRPELKSILKRLDSLAERVTYTQRCLQTILDKQRSIGSVESIDIQFYLLKSLLEWTREQDLPSALYAEIRRVNRSARMD